MAALQPGVRTVCKRIVIALVIMAIAACSTESDTLNHFLIDVPYSSVEALPYQLPDIKLDYGPDPLQYGLLWLAHPSVNTDEPAPLVVLIHGGCWLNTYDIEHTYALSSALAQAGYAVWSLEYRRTGDDGGGWPGTLEDIKTAVSAVPALGNYPVDTRRVAMIGHSAGGHLALLAGAQLPELRAVIGLAAITDLVDYAQGDNGCQRAATGFMGVELSGNEAMYQLANPAGQVLHPVTWLLHGSADAIVPLAQATLPSARTVIVDGGGHFDWVHPDTESFQVLLSVLKGVLSE